MRGFTLAWLGLPLLCLLMPTAAIAQSATFNEYLRSYFTAAEAQRDISGTIAIRRGDALVAYESFGQADWEAGAAITPQTRFQAGGLTRDLVLAVLFQLEAEGRLDRSVGIRSLVPELPVDFRASIGAVLDGTVALPSLAPDELADARTDTFITWFRTAHETGIAVPARDSAAWLPLLTILAERAGNGRIEGLAMFEVFAPQGMTDSVVFRGSGVAPQRQARRYIPAGSPLQIDRAPDLPAGLVGHGWVTTVDDLLRFGSALSRRSIDFFKADGTLAGNLQRQSEGDRTVYHLTGDAPGVRAGILFIPQDDLVVAYALNLVSYPADAMPDVLARLVLSQPLASLPERLASQMWTEGHLTAAGRYVQPDGQILELRTEAGGLVLYPSGELLTPTGQDRLLWRSMNTELLFMRRSDGEVERLAATRHLPLQTPEQFDVGRTDLPELPTETTD